ERAGRTEDESRPEEDEHVPPQVEGVAGEPEGARGDERALRLEHDHAHVVRVELRRGPDAKQEAEREEQDSPPDRDRRRDARRAKQRVGEPPQAREAEAHGDDAGVVEKALCERGHARSQVASRRPWPPRADREPRRLEEAARGRADPCDPRRAKPGWTPRVSA